MKRQGENILGRVEGGFIQLFLDMYSTPFRSAYLLSYSTVMDMHSSMILFILLPLLGISFFFFPIPFSSPFSPRSSSNCKGSLQCPFCHHTCETSICQRGSSCSWEVRYIALRLKSWRASKINCIFAEHIGRRQRLGMKLMGKYWVFKGLKKITRRFYGL